MMNKNESKMKFVAEDKVWKEIYTKSGNSKLVSSTQVGQNMIFKEALRIQPIVQDWIDNKSSTHFRESLQVYFYDEEFLLTKITETLLYLSGSVYYGDISNGKGRPDKRRHKKIRGIYKRILTDLTFDLTFRFVEVIVEASKFYQVERITEITDNGKFDIKMFYTSNIGDEILEKLARVAFKSFYPMPMTEKPLDWTIGLNGEAVGGYKHFQYKLVRAKNDLLDLTRISDKVLESINYIQSTPWIVNKPILEAVRNDLTLPVREDFVKMKYPDNKECKWEISDLESLPLDEQEEIKRERQFYSEQRSLYNAEVSDYESALGKYRAVKLAVSVCEDYKDQEVLYFPHSFDFRGRVYPLTIGLTPQGSDQVKAMLMYKNTKPVTEKGMEWNWAYLASLYGEDKLDFNERVLKGKELVNENYKDADEPYQFLSHQLEMQKVLLDPKYIPNTRIHLDACNSGSQFTSALTQDMAGCLATNVLPTYEDNKQVRQDAYMLVADKALELTRQLIEKEEDKYQIEMLQFFEDLLVNNGRKICKRPVMVSNYGGTAGGRTNILWDMFRELGVQRRWITRKVAAAFSKIIGDSIKGVLQGGKAFEGYIHKMNNIVAKQQKHIWWTTSDGFHIVHVKNMLLRRKKISCKLPGSRKDTYLQVRVFSDEKVNAQKMKSAISPNYIHSLDAELLRRVALRMKEEGIEDTDWIHDSFGCHPNDVDFMLEVSKDEFFKQMERLPLLVLDKELRRQVRRTESNNKKLGLVQVPDLKEFTIDDLTSVYDSDWFFS